MGVVRSELFAGKIELNQNALDRYLAEDLNEDPFTVALVNLMVQAKALGLGTAVLNSIYKKIYKKIIPEIMIKEYGTCPGYWSMVSTKDYKDAKNLIFENRENEYKILISKIDNYDRLVRSKTKQILTNMHNDGVKLCTIVKYGFQLQPITESYDLQSDDKISVLFQSFGARTAAQGTTFSNLYIQSAKRAGTANYISPDKLIDASTCLYPDTTWFVKDMRHNDFRGAVIPLYVAACRSSKEMTIYSNPDYPQYLRYYYNENNLKPLNEENSDIYDYNNSFFKAVIRFFKLLIDKIRTWISGVISA